jgi:hypothetical protein
VSASLRLVTPPATRTHEVIREFEKFRVRMRQLPDNLREEVADALRAWADKLTEVDRTRAEGLRDAANLITLP